MAEYRRKFAGAYMSSKGFLHAYVIAESPTIALAMFLNLISEHDADYDTKETGGAVCDDGSQGCATGAEWVATVVDAEWYRHVMDVPLGTTAYTKERGAGKSKIDKEFGVLTHTKKED